MITLAARLPNATWPRLALLLAGLSACVDPHDPAKQQTPVDDGPGSAQAAQNEAKMAEAMRARGPGEVEGAAAGAQDVPIPEDFEAEYAAQITDDNYEAELDALEEALDAE